MDDSFISGYDANIQFGCFDGVPDDAFPYIKASLSS